MARKRTNSEKPSFVAPARRAPVLARLRNAKMAESPHRYVRGATKLFYEWMSDGSGRSEPEGPAIWICGDCHVGNLGPLVAPNGRVDIQIRDLDQTTIGNPAHDLVRLALSLSSNARGSSLSGAITAKMLEAIVDAYGRAFSRGGPRDDDGAPQTVTRALKISQSRSWKALADERLEDRKPDIPLGSKFWPLTPEERDALKTFVHSDTARELVGAMRGRPDEASVSFEDAAYWVKGCSSLGLLRYAVLISTKTHDRKREHALIDLKEARPPIAPKAKGARPPRDDGERVVTGARALSPNLGDRMVSCRLNGKSFFARELAPADLKLEIEHLDEEEALVSARYLAGVVGRAHKRQLKADEARTWKRELDRRRSKSLNAPSWLWTSVVDLLARHEKAYLEHCRRALAET